MGINISAVYLINVMFNSVALSYDLLNANENC